MGIETAIVIGAVVAAGASTYQAYEAREQRRDLQENLDRQNEQATEVQEQIETKQKEAPKVAADASRRQRMRATANYGRQSTILTGPKGLGSDSSKDATSTILGG